MKLWWLELLMLAAGAGALWIGKTLAEKENDLRKDAAALEKWATFLSSDATNQQSSGQLVAAVEMLRSLPAILDAISRRSRSAVAFIAGAALILGAGVVGLFDAALATPDAATPTETPSITPAPQD